MDSSTCVHGMSRCVHGYDRSEHGLWLVRPWLFGWVGAAACPGMASDCGTVDPSRCAPRGASAPSRDDGGLRCSRRAAGGLRTGAWRRTRSCGFRVRPWLRSGYRRAPCARRLAEALRVAPASSLVGMIVAGSLITYHSEGWSDANDRRRSGLQSTHRLPYCGNGWKLIPSAARSLNG
jgi:hypothetical protein